MSSWQDDAIRQKAPKKDAPADSWWADPKVQSDRSAFQRQLVDSEIQRMNGSKDGGPRGTHDKFPQKRK